MLIFRGVIARAAYPIQTPKLQSYGGVQCVPGHQECSENKVERVVGGMPILVTRFHFEYALAEAPDNTKLPIFVTPTMASM